MKEALKLVKLNEGTISMILGAAVVIVVGLIVVNYFRNLSNITSQPSITNSAAKTEANEHIVAAGESLWTISEKYYNSGYNWVDIAKENNLTDASEIEVGQKLAIPSVTAKESTITEQTVTVDETPPAAAEEAEKVAMAENTISGTSYTVMKGDHLWGIAVRAYGDGYQWTKIWNTNLDVIKNPNLIYPDQQLQLPR